MLLCWASRPWPGAACWRHRTMPQVVSLWFSGLPYARLHSFTAKAWRCLLAGQAVSMFVLAGKSAGTLLLAQSAGTTCQRWQNLHIQGVADHQWHSFKEGRLSQEVALGCSIWHGIHSWAQHNFAQSGRLDTRTGSRSQWCHSCQGKPYMLDPHTPQPQQLTQEAPCVSRGCLV